jgi:hypothetical protein
MPSGELILFPTAQGWRLYVGCWEGTPDDLRTLIARDDGWPEASTDEERARRRPYLEAALVLCDLHMTANQDALDAVIAKWGVKS